MLICDRHAQKLELLLHPASACASGQASIADTRGANDIRKKTSAVLPDSTIASTEIQANAGHAPWKSREAEWGKIQNSGRRGHMVGRVRWQSRYAPSRG
jgi:hypothetical protein